MTSDFVTTGYIFFIIDVCDSEKPCINWKKIAMILLNRESLFGKYVL